jgi:hypothetical protein
LIASSIIFPAAIIKYSSVISIAVELFVLTLEYPSNRCFEFNSTEDPFGPYYINKLRAFARVFDAFTSQPVIESLGLLFG